MAGALFDLSVMSGSNILGYCTVQSLSSKAPVRAVDEIINISILQNQPVETFRPLLDSKFSQKESIDLIKILGYIVI